MQAVKNDQIKQTADEEIIAEVKNGKVELFGEIVKRYNQRMYRITVSYGIYDDDCEEVIQTAYISAYEKINQFRGEAKFSTWLIRILINECLMLKRKQKKIIRIDEQNLVTIPSGHHLNPESEYMEKERREILETAIKQLPEKYRSVFILREIEGMNIEEAAETLAISKVNVKVRLNRARAMLKNIIGDVSDLSNLLTFGNERCDRVTEAVMKFVNKKIK